MLIASVAWLAGSSRWTAAEAQTTSATVGESAWAWGYNNNGQLGDGTKTNSTIPVKVQGMTRVTQVDSGGSFDTGSSHSLALTDDGKVWAWGYNNSGQLGDGTTTTRTAPVQVLGSDGQPLTDVRQVSAGGAHALAVKNDGTAWAWGYNFNGQLGDGTTTTRTAPVQVTGLTGVKQISAGTGSSDFSLALKDIGTVWAWGGNAAGELGDGTTTQRLTPVRSGTLTEVTQVDAGGFHALALKDDGTARSWGYNGNGQLGNSTTVDVNSPPSQVTGFTGGLQVSAGYAHSLVVKADATPPTVALTAPTDGATVGGNVALSADASDNMGLDKVQFFVNGESVGTDITAPYSINWNSSAYLDDQVSVQAKAFDLAGNATTATRTVRVDNTAPETTLDATGPTGTTTDKTASFAFSSEEGAIFECSLDGAAFASCSSPKEYQNLGNGAHEFRVRALDAAGNADATPASRSWTVDATPAAPTGKKVSPRANVTATFSEAMDETSVETSGAIKLVRKGTTRAVAATVAYDRAAKKVTLNPKKSLVRGATYRATVTTGAEDLAGNPLAAPKAWSFTVKR